jgi:guanylate kinase
MIIHYLNFIIAISSPSGAGKSTITRRLLEWDSSIKLSVSATTRKPREGEVDGVDYYFLTKDEFEKEIKNNNFVEYAKVFDNYYGTLRREIESKFDNGKDVILDIDWQGVRLVSDQIDAKRLLKIFILPPSIKELENRLRARGKDNNDVIENRMKRARDEISHFNEYDFVVINDNLESAIEQIKSIIIAKRLENVKQDALEDFVNNL